MNLNVVLPLCSSVVSLTMAAMLFGQWRARRRSYQAVWTLGMLWYGLAAGTEFLGGAFGWSEPLYRAWYLIGAIWVAGWLGLGTVLLMSRTRFGYAYAVSLFLAGLFTSLAEKKYDYPDAGISATVYFIVAAHVAALIALDTYRGGSHWPRLAAGAVVAGTVASVVLMAFATIPSPGWAVDPATGIPTGDLMPGYLRLLAPLFNISGAFALVLGGLYSAYIFMPKRRVIRYTLDRDGSRTAYARNLAIAPVAIAINLAASLPGAAGALVTGRLNSRVPATLLIAVGAFVPAMTSGLNRFGDTSPFFVGELLGVMFLFAGFLISAEVFHDVRVPFTAPSCARARRSSGPAPLLGSRHPTVWPPWRRTGPPPRTPSPGDCRTPAAGSPVGVGSAAGDPIRRGGIAVLEREAAVSEPFRLQEREGVPAAGIVDPPHLGHDLEREQNVVELDREVDQIERPAPVRRNERPIRPAPEQAARQEQFGGSIGSLQGRVITVALPVGPQASSRDGRLLERRRPGARAAVAVPAAVGPLAADQPIDQPDCSFGLQPQHDRVPDGVAFLGGAAPHPIILARDRGGAGRVHVLPVE